MSPRRVVAAVGLVVLGLAAPRDIAAQQSPQPAAILGRVLTQAAGPLSQTEVGIVGTPFAIFTDSLGRFHLRGLDPGSAVLRVRRIGFEAQFIQVELLAGVTRVTEIMLAPGYQRLPDLEVVARDAKPIEYAPTTKYDEFFRRRLTHAGTFLTRSEIRRQAPGRTVDLLRSVPGSRVRYRYLGPGGTEVDFSRCGSGHVGVWVDGRKVNWQPEHQLAESMDLTFSTALINPEGFDVARRQSTILAEVLDEVHPLDIEMMEVYRGVGSIPAEFRDAGCGAIVIWTR